MKIPHSSTMNRELSVSMTPMIDVVFLLLIFFLCTASFQIVESMLPSPVAAAGSSPVELPPELLEMSLERVLIHVASHQRVTQLTINGQPSESLDHLLGLLTALAEIDSSIPVVLDIDGEALLGLAIDVYDRTRLSGFDQIQFAAKVTP